jgi:hypothetical protein
MTSRTKQLSLIALACCFGIVIGVVVSSRLLNPKFPSRWFILIQPASDTVVPPGNSVDVGTHVSVSYSSATIVESDIPALQVKTLSGKAKFLPHASTNDAQSIIGYIVTVSSDSLDKEKLPEKYKKEKVISTKGGPLTVLPLEQATYEVYFVLRLLDRDGFELLSISSPKHHLQSGETAQIQGQTAPSVPSRIAAVTDSMTLHLVIDKCLSATTE